MKVFRSVQRHRFPKISSKFNIFSQGTYDNALELRDYFWELIRTKTILENRAKILLDSGTSIAHVLGLHEFHQDAMSEAPITAD